MFWVLAALPRYKDFAANISYYLPFGNSTLYGTVKQKADASRQRVDWYNADGDIIEIVLNYDVSHNERYKFVTTEQVNQSCYFYKGVFYGEFIPTDYDDYEFVGQDFIANVLVNHYQQRGAYVPPHPHGDPQHIEVREWYRDFYTTADGLDRPIRWVLTGKSNYYSHFDYYIIDYITFEQFDSISLVEFEFNESSINGKELSRHCDQEPYRSSDIPMITARFVAFEDTSSHTQESAVTARNLEKLARIRANKYHTFKVTANSFINMDYELFKKSHTGFYRTRTQLRYFDDKTIEIAQSVDYRTSGATQFVKDQNFCGSCWAYSAAGCLEQRLNLKLLYNGHSEHPLVQISAQQIVDCFWGVPNLENGSHGCNGGEENDVLSWWADNKLDKFVFEHDYPYLGQNDFCKEGRAKPLFDYQVFAYHDVPPNDVAAMKRALMSGPVSVGIAIEESFLYYAGGIYNDPACSSDPRDTSHAVVLVGYGVTENFVEYWILKNSWSSLWGVDGYAYVAMHGNICGVLNWGGYVDISGVK